MAKEQSKVRLQDVVSYDAEALAMVMQALQDLDSDFCRLMFSGNEFSVQLDLHGANGRLIHARTQHQEFRRPKSGANAKKSNGSPNRG